MVDESGNVVDTGPEPSLEAVVAMDRDRRRRRAAGYEVPAEHDSEVLIALTQLARDLQTTDADAACARLEHLTPVQRAQVERAIGDLAAAVREHEGEVR